MRTVFCVVLLFFISSQASEFIHEDTLLTYCNAPFSEFIKYIDGKSINKQYKCQNLTHFPDRNAATILELLCECKTDVRQKFEKVVVLYENGGTITDQLICSVARSSDQDNLEIMNYLINKGGDVNAIGIQSSGGYYVTALHNAVFADSHRNNEPMIAFLLEHGANANSTLPQDNSRPLHYAAKYCRNYRIMQLLIDHGACIDAEDDIKQNALHILVSRPDKAKLIKVILQRSNSDLVNKKNIFGVTPLYKAAMTNNQENLIALLKSPLIDLEIRSDSHKKTALENAKYYNYTLNGQILIRFKTLKKLLSRPMWANLENNFISFLQIPEKLIIHKIAYWTVKIEFS